jgi:pentatricopeptide repeat domain-containing protein 1
VQEAREALSEMIGNGITPDKTVYNCLIRKYLKLGKIEETENLWNEMERICTEDGTASVGKT